MSWVLAVDFGTSNTSAAHRIGPDRVESLPLTHTSNLMPSSVYLDPHGGIATGEVAVNQATVDPAGFVAAPKAHVSDRSMLVRGHHLPVAATIAAVLRTVHTRALTAHNNQPPGEVVLTHPEAWSGRELAVLREAATAAGLGGHVSLISEPRAAAFYYSRRHDAKIVKGSTIAVFDFGGGTCDVAVLTATDEWTFEVLRAGGDTALGGKNLDATISRWVEQHLADENPQLVAWLRSPAGLDARRTLDDQIRRAKELLSDAPSATIRVAGHGADLTLTLTREEFEQLIEPQIGRGVQLAATVLREAGIDRGRLQALYLTGGSSRIPYVHRRLAELGPIATLDDPKTVVAKGAAGFVAGGRATDPAPWRATEPVRREPAQPPRTPIPAPSFTGVPVPEPAPVSGRSRTPFVIAGAALATVLAAAGVYFAVDGGETPATAAASTIDAAAPAGAPPATSDSAYISEVSEDVLPLLPSKLITSSSSCDKSGFSYEGALQLRCVVTADSSVGKAMRLAEDDDQWVTAWRDDQYARSNFIRYRDRTLSGYASRVHSSGDRIVNYATDDTYSSGFETIDRKTGLILTYSVDTVEQGLTLATELGFADS